MPDIPQHDIDRSLSELEHLKELASRLGLYKDVKYWNTLITKKKEQNA